MGMYYKMNVLKELKENGYTTTRIRQEKLIPESAMTKIRRGEIVGIIVLEKLCQLLECQPGTIIGYKKD